MTPFTLNIKGRTLRAQKPLVMGIINLTPDSFYDKSRKRDTPAIQQSINKMVADGADILDFGACSTRPEATPCSVREEMDRLRPALDIFRRMNTGKPASVDTFRADVARMAVEEYGVDIINDISAGELDPEMFPTAARLRVPYILTHNAAKRGNGTAEVSESEFLAGVLRFFQDKIVALQLSGVADIILDPGFGFGKTVWQNHLLLHNLQLLGNTFHKPVLAGVSRKSMITKVLNISAHAALNATTVLHTIALLNGASILRVHDVKEAVEAVKLCHLSGFQQLETSGSL